MMGGQRRRAAGVAAIAVVAVLTGVGLWQTSRSEAPRAKVVSAEPKGIMGTTCTLAAVCDGPEGEAALAAAEGSLRHVEALMSTWLTESEISRLNQAPAGEEVALSADTLEVMRGALRAWRETGGAFDVTSRPAIERWRKAGEEGRVPTEEGLRMARAASSWDLLEITGTGARKLAGSAQADLGGIAKGYGIDRAVAAMKEAGVQGGLVDVGGDLRCFGRPPSGEGWRVAVKDPFTEGTLVELEVGAGGVCTSGNYARYETIGGKRYSHIVDPRTGWPAEAAPSVTVVADTAMEADIWATALSVLGEEGIQKLPPRVEAMLVIGEPGDYEIVSTPGMKDMIRGAAPGNLLVEGRARTEASLAAGG